MEEKVFFQDGDILWTQKSGGIVISGQTSEKPLKVGQVDVASPIVLTEDILQKVLGFKKDCYGGFVHGGIHINFNPKNTGTLFSFEDKPIRYLNEIQHIAKEKGVELIPNLQQLKEIMLNE